MRKLIFFIALCFLFFSCASIKEVPESANQDTAKNLNTQNSAVAEYKITSDIFDTLQRPLSFALSPQCKPITRLNWEYHMAGIGWWDIYLMTGRKLGNGIYEKSIENKSNCQVIELHNTRTQYDNSILGVEVIYISSNKSTLETMRSDFSRIATSFTGKQATNENDGIISWDAGWIHYTSYPIQYHESGKWIYIISSFDSAHSPY